MSKKMSTTSKTPLFKMHFQNKETPQSMEKSEFSLTPLVNAYLETGELPEDPTAREQVLEVVSRPERNERPFKKP